MDSLLRRRQKPRTTEVLIKEALLCQLSYTIKEIQLLNSQSNEPFTSSEATNSLIVVIEAIFLHGLKRGIFKSALKSVQGVEEKKPQPSFWSLLRSYTHRHKVDTIKALSQITTEVGLCRVWVRMSLNEAELPSYFQAMETDRRPVNSNYNQFAFLRDRETCDTASKLLEGLLSVTFHIPVNSSILNIWSNEPLMLSGTWSPSIKTPVSSAVDVAEGIADDDFDDTCSIRTSSSITTLSTLMVLDESQALKMILDTPVKTLEKEINAVAVSYEKPVITEEVEELQEGDHDDQVMGNSLIKDQGWSSAVEEPVAAVSLTRPAVVQQQQPLSKTYSSLLESYGSPPKHTFDINDVFDENKPECEPREEESEEEDFEVLSDSLELDTKLFRIVREKGLRLQRYNCAQCQLSIGLNLGEARFCYFTAEYFCDNCHINEVSVIPSRVLFNWDHTKYPVCNEASSYINEISHKPVIDIKKLNNKLYSIVAEMKELRTLRFQLNMLRAYLDSCREPVLVEMHKKIWPREYWCEHIHLYSLNDLMSVPNRALASEISNVISFARNHVITCWLCSQKGFICEVCRNLKVIYPFDCTSTYRCSKCHAVYHEKCLPSQKNCPKCKRMESRSLLQEDSLDFEDE